ncbi:MAG: hypothetical protein KDC34_15590 [Saprospiraceae bacterium]|nr:hypothetical protein [Saprospiraceae bacterium]
MKYLRKHIFFLSLSVLSSCGDLVDSESSDTNKSALIPVNYDFANLGLYLNASINDTLSAIEWRWDYLTSENGMPDTTGNEYYMNISQPVFSFNGETTLPALSIKTDKNRIIEFSVTVIFHLPNEESNSVFAVMDSLKTFDLFENENVKREIIENGRFLHSSDLAEEEIIIKFGEDQYDFDSMTYSIKIKEPHKGESY